MPTPPAPPRRRGSAASTAVALGLGLTLLGPPALPAQQHAEQRGQDVATMATMDLDQLARIKVTTVSREPETIANSAGAVTVVTREDIRRSGAASLPEALRLVRPGGARRRPRDDLAGRGAAGRIRCAIRLAWGHVPPAQSCRRLHFQEPRR